MAVTPEKEDIILKKMLKILLVNNAICIVNLPNRIKAVAEHMGEKPTDVLDVLAPILKEAINEGLDPERLKETNDEDHHRSFHFWGGGH